jgi:hypothetical protein
MQGTALLKNSLRADIFLLSFVESIGFQKLGFHSIPDGTRQYMDYEKTSKENNFHIPQYPSSPRRKLS